MTNSGSAARLHKKWAAWIGRHPRVAIGITTGLHFLGFFITIVLWLADVSVLPLDLGPAWSYGVRGSDIYEQQLAYWNMIQDTDLNMWEKTLPKQLTRSIEFRDQNLEIVYDGSCFTRSNLASIRTFEDMLYNSSGYQSSICQVDSSGTCKKPRSPLRFFDGSYEQYFSNITDSSGARIFRPDLDFNRVEEILTQTAFFADGRSSKDSIREQGDPDIKKILDYHIGRPALDYDENNPVTARICRSQFYIGYPIEGFNNVKDRTPTQIEAIRNLQKEHWEQLLEDTDNVGTMNMYYSSSGLRTTAYNNDVELSFLLCIGSGLLAWIGLMHLSKSFLIGTLVVYGIAGTWFWTNLVYRWILWVEHFGLPQHLGVFVCGVIGISFSLYQSAVWNDHFDEADTAVRIEKTLSLTNRLGLVCSLVAASSFWVFCFSTVQVVMPFCLFLGTFCIANYVNFYVYLPTVFALQSSVLNWGRTEHVDLYAYLGPKLASFLWRRILGHRWIRWLGISISCVAVGVLAIFVASQLSVKRQQPIIWTSGAHNYDNFGKFDEFSKEQFGGTQSDTNTKLKIVFGVEKYDKADCHPGSFGCPRGVVYDESFDLSSNTAQQQLLNFCNDLSNLDTATVNLLKIRRQKTGATVNGLRPLEIKCFIKAQEQYLRRSAPTLTLPFNYSDMQSTMISNPFAYPQSVYSSTSYFPPFANAPGEPSCRTCDSYYRQQEFGILDWITNGSDIENPSNDIVDFIDSYGGIADPYIEIDDGTMQYAGYYGSVARFATVEVNLTLNSENADYEEALSVKDSWDAYIKAESTRMIQPFHSVFQTCQKDQTWSWMEVQKQIIPSLLTCIIISSLIVGLAVLICTNNVILAILALGYIAAVVVCIMGVFAILEWDVGIVELLNLSMIVGLLSQIAVPITLSYGKTDQSESRDQRTQQALREIMLPVIGGSILAFTASIFLLGSPLWYFWTFAVSYLCTLGLGVAIALLLLVTMCGLVGPQNTEGRLVGPLDSYRFGRHGSSKINPATSSVNPVIRESYGITAAVEKTQVSSVQNNIPHLETVATNEVAPQALDGVPGASSSAPTKAKLPRPPALAGGSRPVPMPNRRSTPMQPPSRPSLSK